MDTLGLNKIVDALANAFSVFDFSFFISGAVTLGFIALDLHYYGHDGILHLEGWIGVVIYILAVYVCGLMSWTIGKMIRWTALRVKWRKSDGVKGDFNKQFENIKGAFVGIMNDADRTNNLPNDVLYSRMWLEIEKQPQKASKLNTLNKTWVMIALFEGLSFSWIVGLLVYLDGWLVGKWIQTSCWFFNIVPCVVLVGMLMISLHRATKYSRDLIKDVIVAYYN